MRPKLLLRIALGCTLFFALGHTIGHFTWRQTDDPTKREVIALMDGRSFDMNGSPRTIGENYTGYSFMLIVSLLALSWILLILSARTEREPGLVKALLLPITGCLAGFAAFCFSYFFLVPAVTCAAAAACAALAWISLKARPAFQEA